METSGSLMGLYLLVKLGRSKALVGGLLKRESFKFVWEVEKAPAAAVAATVAAAMPRAESRVDGVVKEERDAADAAAAEADEAAATALALAALADKAAALADAAAAAADAAAALADAAGSEILFVAGEETCVGLGSDELGDISGGFDFKDLASLEMREVMRSRLEVLSSLSKGNQARERTDA